MLTNCCLLVFGQSWLVRAPPEVRLAMFPGSLPHHLFSVCVCVCVCVEGGGGGGGGGGGEVIGTGEKGERDASKKIVCGYQNTENASARQTRK